MKKKIRLNNKVVLGLRVKTFIKWGDKSAKRGGARSKVGGTNTQKKEK